MIRLHITVEGQTEQAFVKRVLAPHLGRSNVFADARGVLTSKDKRTNKRHSGGLVSYQKTKADIVTWMKEDQARDVRFSTMFDLYQLPTDFPGYKTASTLEPYERVARLEAALKEELGSDRFIPYLQLHEFEALILADPAQLELEYPDHAGAISSLVKMVGDHNPELIDGGSETAPSKRILAQIRKYDKRTSPG